MCQVDYLDNKGLSNSIRSTFRPVPTAVVRYRTVRHGPGEAPHEPPFVRAEEIHFPFGAVLADTRLREDRVKQRALATVAALAVTVLMHADGIPDVGLVPLATGLVNTVGLKDPVDGSTDVLYVVRQSGQILVLDHGQVRAAPFLDIGSKVSKGFEQGLLGLAFHPAYAANGVFYINYTNMAGNTIVARYVRSSDPFKVDPASEMVILQIPQPFENHNGGDMHFGPDGYLYIATGDGGSGGDPLNSGQRLDTLLGKILRIDIDNGPPPYSIPPTNPFAGSTGSAREIWHWGLRNPWRFSFDRATGDLWIGDVGQGQWEEVDLQPAGQGGLNFGWRRKEGTHCYNPSTGCDVAGLTAPVFEYSHDATGGCSITGGYRYRGSRYPRMYGTYFFGDFCSGVLYAGVPDGGGMSWVTLRSTGQSISSFAEDETGELYLITLGGDIYRIADTRLQRIRAIRR